MYTYRIVYIHTCEGRVSLNVCLYVHTDGDVYTHTCESRVLKYVRTYPCRMYPTQKTLDCLYELCENKKVLVKNDSSHRVYCYTVFGFVRLRDSFSFGVYWSGVQD